MSIWPTLYTTQGRNIDLEAIGIRSVFNGMEDLYPLPGWQRFQVADGAGGYIPFAVATPDGDGFESFRVALAS